MPSARPTETHHARITEELRRKIIEGDWPPGHQLAKETELEDGRRYVLTPGLSYQVADGAEPHRSRTALGATLFIVD